MLQKLVLGLGMAFLALKLRAKLLVKPTPHNFVYNSKGTNTPSTCNIQLAIEGQHIHSRG